jgi:Cupin-like domain
MSHTIHHRHQATAAAAATTAASTSTVPRFSTMEQHPHFSRTLTAGGTEESQQKQQQQQQQQQRKRFKRKQRPGNDDDVALIMILVGLVCIAIVVAIVLVIRLLQTAPTSAVEGLFGGQFATDQRHPSFLDNNNNNNNKHHYDPSQDEKFPDLPASKIYTIPHSMPHIGDRSDEYAELRKITDAKLTYQPERSLKVVQEMIQHHPTTFDEDIPYDIFNCPDKPPLNYPYEWKTLKVLEHWNPEDTTIPDKLHQGLCVFDYRKDYVKALTYRTAELPFVVRHDPEVAVTVERWASPGFLETLMGDVMHRAEESKSNHFMFWVPGDAKRRSKGGILPPSHEPPGWSSPTKMIRMTYHDFLLKAAHPKSHKDPHWYFRLIGCGETGPTGNCDSGSSEWLFDELTFFQPRTGLLYLTDPTQQRGIHCRIGMEGVTIANHFDQSRNAIALLSGQRRYILSHPKHCANLALYPRGHPSARHSAVDWSHPDLEAFPSFAQAMSNEILLQAGDVLYLPTNYFHYIVSLGINFQCNTRSGQDDAALAELRACGF